MIKIENKELLVLVNEKGAELTRLYDKVAERDYIWSAGEDWPKHAPILFPTIGGFQSGKYLVNGKEYEMSAHGFARDMVFEVEQKTDTSIVMLLKSNDDTKKQYPYDFELRVVHEVIGSQLKIKWNVTNKGAETMYFSIGAHPGFELEKGSKLSDYSVTLDQKYDLESRKVMGRLVTDEKYSVDKNTDRIVLTKELLKFDAVIFEEGINSMVLESKNSNYRLKLEFNGFPVVAIWTRPDCIDRAKFVCIEPWIGLNDTVNQPVTELSNKYMIQSINADNTWETSYSMKIGE